MFIGIRVSKRNDVMQGMLVTGWSLCRGTCQMVMYYLVEHLPSVNLMNCS